MRRILFVLLLVLSTPSVVAQTPYKTPPQVIVDILDAPPLPSANVSPDRQWLLLLEQRSMPSIAELAQPMLRLAGNRINPRVVRIKMTKFKKKRTEHRGIKPLEKTFAEVVVPLPVAQVAAG